MIKGMSYGWNSIREQYKTEDAYKSLVELKSFHCNWIALAFTAWQDEYYSTNIYYDYKYTMTDEDIECAVNHAHELGMKVCLKPVVNVKSGVWRGHIAFPNDESGERYWNQWFDSYLRFLLHYAKIAEKLKCEMLCVGCEYINADRRTSDWLHIIEEVRKVYHGPIVYNSNHGYEQNVQWFDQTDYIGTSAYYGVGTKHDVSLEGMRKRWKECKASMARLYEEYHKKIIFMEAGCMSGKNCSLKPWTYQSDLYEFDETEQANFYLSLLEEFWNEPWFAGVFWWDWTTNFSTLQEQISKVNFSIYGKKSGEIVKDWFNKY